MFLFFSKNKYLKNNVFMGVFLLLIVCVALGICKRATPLTVQQQYEDAWSKVPGLHSFADTFPSSIPSDAANVKISTHSDMGGMGMYLQFTIELDSIQRYANMLENVAIWSGLYLTTEEFTNKLPPLGELLLTQKDCEIPADTVVYFLEGKPYHPNNWNHGKCAYATISKQFKCITFSACKW